MSDRPARTSPDTRSPLQVARESLGQTQSEVAEMIGVPLSSYIPWDQGKRRPRDVRVAQTIAEVLQTPSDVLWPPEGNPHVGPKFMALREQRAREEALAREAEDHQSAEAGLAVPSADPDEIWTAPVDVPAPRRVPDPREHVRTLDGGDDLPAGVGRPTRRRRFLIPTAASLAVVVAAGTAIVTTGDPSPVPPARPAARISPPTAERERAAQRTAMVQARDRGDFDGAITIAASLNDTAATTQLRASAGGLLARRARTAAERGDLSLASARLGKAQKRYGDLPAIDVVRQRIAAIKDAREKRAADRKRAAKKRAASAAARAATARRRAPSQAAAPPSSSATPAAPAAPSTPSSPTPSAPAPSSGSGGGSGGSGGSSSSKPVLPDFY